MNKIVKLAATAGFVLATFAGAQSASAQTCFSPDDVSSPQEWSCGFISAVLELGITEATVTTTNLRFVGTPHWIHIQLDCSHGASAENGDAFSINDNSDTVACPNGEVIQHVSAWVEIDRSGSGQGGSEGEDGDDQGEGEGEGEGDDEGGDEGGDDEGGE